MENVNIVSLIWFHFNEFWWDRNFGWVLVCAVVWKNEPKEENLVLFVKRTCGWVWPNSFDVDLWGWGVDFFSFWVWFVVYSDNDSFLKYCWQCWWECIAQAFVSRFSIKKSLLVVQSNAFNGAIKVKVVPHCILLYTYVWPGFSKSIISKFSGNPVQGPVAKCNCE